MNINSRWKYKEIAISIVSFFCMLLIQGTLPFFSNPELLQAVWSMGFAQSLANNHSVFDVFARDIGIPGPAAMALGLAGAYPASLLIRLGIHAADAYSIAAGIWFAVAFVSAIRISIIFGASKLLAVLLGCTWLSMPMIWAHAGYSMVSWGMALLPFYFMAAITLFQPASDSGHLCAWSCCQYVMGAVVAVFMDGYTFMMFATGSTMLLVYELVFSKQHRRFLLAACLPVHFCSFSLAYYLFSQYISKSGFEPYSLEHFRGWGLDLTYILIPTKGVLWFPDLIGFSIFRSDKLHFGDSSVWKTTFLLPLISAGAFAWWRLRDKWLDATAFALMALFGLYMGLGPSLKINSTKPVELQATHSILPVREMSEQHAIMPTGNAWISENLPGFSVMRASYRWTALSVFAFWALLAMWIARIGKSYPFGSTLLLFILIALNLPNIAKHINQNIRYRNSFIEVDRDLVGPLTATLKNGDKCLFAPTGNDFLANYFVPKAALYSYNIGGDKNLAQAQKSWPREVISRFDTLNEATPFMALSLLASGKADAVIFPHFNMLKSGYSWPPNRKNVDKIQSELDAFLIQLSNFPYTEVHTSKYFTIFQLNPEFVEESARSNMLISIQESVASKIYPMIPNAESVYAPFVLSEGWYGRERDFTWSRNNAVLNLPIPDEPNSQASAIILRFSVYGASITQPVKVYFESQDSGEPWSQSVSATSEIDYMVTVPIGTSRGARSVSISIPAAMSPLRPGKSPDTRILGIALKQIKLGLSSAASNQPQSPIRYPLLYRSGENGTSLLNDGWYSPEDSHTWSSAEAKMILPIPEGYESSEHSAVLGFLVFGADSARPVDVVFESAESTWLWQEKVTATSGKPMNITVPVGVSPRSIRIRVPSAISPEKLYGAPDPRIIGIAVQDLALTPNRASADNSRDPEQFDAAHGASTID